MEKSAELIRTETDDKILKVIEDSIKTRKENCVQFAKVLKKRLFEVIPKEDLIKRIHEINEHKILYFLRHFRAEHNGVKGTNPTDSELTPQGMEQGKEFVENYKATPRNHELIFVSSLKRTIGTLKCIHSVFGEGTPFIITDLIREKLTCKMKNTGMALPKLKDYCKDSGMNCNTDFITKVNWWIDDDWEEYVKGNEIEIKDEHEKEEDEGFKARVFIAVLWAMFRKEKNVLFISHGKVYRCLDENKVTNGEYKEWPKEIIEEKMNYFLNDDTVF